MVANLRRCLHYHIITYKSNIDRKKIRFLEGRHLLHRTDVTMVALSLTAETWVHYRLHTYLIKTGTIAINNNLTVWATYYSWKTYLRHRKTRNNYRVKPIISALLGNYYELSDDALNYRHQLTSSLIVVPVADWLMDWRVRIFSILDCRVDLCVRRQINSFGNSQLINGWTNNIDYSRKR